MTNPQITPKERDCQLEGSGASWRETIRDRGTGKQFEKKRKKTPGEGGKGEILNPSTRNRWGEDKRNQR